ncbi:MAG TPA: S41 family peptidase [Chthoniobacterales bacterium]|nr:S41 family peptidase [Chthoniobacterales bacterium]
MLQGIRLFLLALCVAGSVASALAQTPAPTSPPPAAPTPTPTAESLINAMSGADLQQALQLLKSNYIDAEALNETEMNRALLSGLLQRLGPGVMILPERPADEPGSGNTLFAEILDGHIGYVRVGELNAANLKALDTNLQNFAAKKVDALVLDLRASTRASDFALAADFAKRFVAKGKPLFTVRKSGSKQERAFTSDAEPAYRGLMLVLADGDTSGAAEALAGVLRVHNKALIIGQPTAGRAVEYSELPLNSGRILRIAAAEAVLPEGRALFPGGLKPDLAVEMPPADKRLVFQQAAEKGMGPFIHEAERPHLNEAALIAGRNPEIDAMEAAQRARNRAAEKPATRDPVLQRAMDVVTSLSIYQQR